MVAPFAAGVAGYGAGLGLKALDEVLMEPAKNFSKWVWGGNKNKGAQGAQQGAYQGGAPTFQSQSSDPAQRLAMSLSVPQQQQGASYTPMAPTPTSSPGQIAMQQGLAQNAIAEGSSTSPVAGPWGALARALQGTVGGYMANKANSAENERYARMAQSWNGTNGDLGQMAQAAAQAGDYQMATQIAMKQAEIGAQRAAQQARRGPVQVYNPQSKQMEWTQPDQAVGMPSAAPDSAKPEEMVQVFGPDGTPHYVPRSQAAGQQSGLSLGQQEQLRRAGASSVTVGGEQYTPPGPLPGHPEAPGLWQQDPKGHWAQLQGTEPPKPEPVKPPTDAERIAAGYAERMDHAEGITTKETESGYQPSGAVDTVRNIAGETAATYLSSPQRQRVRQAQEDWVRAKLRKESGAAIPKDEMEGEIRTYFPQPGETDPSVIKQKAESRAIAIKAMRRDSGSAAPAAPAAEKAKPPAAGDVIDGYTFKGGNPNDQNNWVAPGS